MSQTAHKSPADAPAEPVLEELYQRYIKPLSPRDRLRLVEMIVRELASERASQTKQPLRNIMELHGLGKDIWQGVDAQEYVNELRREWEHRP